MAENNNNSVAPVVASGKAVGGLSPIKFKEKPKKFEKIEMEAVAIDGFGNRIFVSAEKSAEFKKKNKL